jgi:hypothetical protein
MKNTKISDFIYYSALALIILVSFLNFSALFFPLPDTNTAITILMTPGFSAPGDLYFWGQNFAGNLVPFLAQLLCISYRFPPDMAVSVIHYLILAGGFLAVSTLFRSRFAKLVLAVVWFFPSWYFLGQVTSVFGLQLSLFVIGIYLMNREKKTLSFKMQILWLSLACIVFIISLWVSDLSIVSLVLLFIFLISDKRNLLKKSNFLAAIREKQLIIKILLILVITVAGIGFLLYAKHTAGKAITYNNPLFGTPASILNHLKLILTSIFHVLIFSTHNVTASIYAWALIAGIPFLSAVSIKKIPFRNYFTNQRWLLFFTLNGLILCVCLILSNWVIIHGAAAKYYSIVFISIWIAFLLFIESTDSTHPALRKYILMLIVVLGVVSSITPLFIPKNLPSVSSALNELRTLENIGLIGESSIVYKASSIDPDHIKATPHDKELLRNFNLVLDVLKQKRIYLVRNGWLASFPDTISQFGILFQRTGEPFQKAGYDLCRYQRIIKRTIFLLDKMQTQGKVMTDTTAYSGKSAMITTPFDRSKHFIYGPFINLHKGKYTVLFRLKVSHDLGINNVAVLNISANFGKDVLTSRTIRLCDFGKNNDFEEFDVPLEIAKEYEGVEFRIMYLGETELYFDRVVLIEH